jgi:hypothetical protein
MCAQRARLADAQNDCAQKQKQIDFLGRELDASLAYVSVTAVPCLLADH